MSRHREVRNLDLDDYADDYYEEEYEEEEYDADASEYYYSRDGTPRQPKADLASATSHPSEHVSSLAEHPNKDNAANDMALLKSGIEYIDEITGGAYDQAIIRDAIGSHGNDANAALQWLLDNAGDTAQSSSGFQPAKPPASTSQSNVGPSTNSHAKQQMTNKSSSSAPTKSRQPIGQAMPLHAEAKKKRGGKKKAINQLQRDMEALGLNDEPGQADGLVPQPQSPPPSGKSKKVVNALEEFERRRQTEKEKLSLVVVGHVDAGKSTIMGHMLYTLGTVDQRTMHKFEKESQLIGKGSFAYAWVLDETEEERNRGVTMDIAETLFETPTKSVTLLDAPGHRDFIPNMVTGAAQADAAVLVISAAGSEFESGFETGGQTREHTLLVKALGVSQLVVAVNKLDMAGWAQQRFEELKEKIGPFLKQAGFHQDVVIYVPCSGLTGDNLVAVNDPALAAWYKGPSLFDAIDSMKTPPRLVDRPLRLTVSDIFKTTSSGTVMAGMVHAGHVVANSALTLMPGSVPVTVKSIDVGGEPARVAVGGDRVILSLAGVDWNQVSVGMLLCNPGQLVRPTRRIRAQIVVFEVDVPILQGAQAVLHYLMVNEPCVVSKLVAQLDKTTGEVVRKSPRVLGRNSMAIVEISLGQAVCLEEFKVLRELGRFALRDKGKTIAAGIVVKCLAEQ